MNTADYMLQNIVVYKTVHVGAVSLEASVIVHR